MMIQIIRYTVVLFFCLALGFNSVQGQTTITFRVNIADLTKDHSFEPEGDRVELIGNRYPLSAIEPILLEQDESNRNLFTIDIDFPVNLVNQSVEYQFRVRLNNSYWNEDIPRTLRIPQNNRTLDAIYFNSYAW